MITKTKLIEHYGNKNQVAKSIGFTAAAIGQMPEEVSKATIERIVGHLYLHKKPIPDFLLGI